MACTFSMLSHGSGSSSKYCLLWALWLLQSYARKAVHSGIPANMTSIIGQHDLHTVSKTQLLPLPAWLTHLSRPASSTPMSAISRIRHLGTTFKK